MKRTLREKLGKDVEPYIILGACNPQLAARALEVEPGIGLLLPCNVIVATTTEGTRVGAVNPQSLVDFTGNPALADVAREADARSAASLPRSDDVGSRRSQVIAISRICLLPPICPPEPSTRARAALIPLPRACYTFRRR